jgi:hypothetical protein
LSQGKKNVLVFVYDFFLKLSIKKKMSTHEDSPHRTGQQKKPVFKYKTSKPKYGKGELPRPKSSSSSHWSADESSWPAKNQRKVAEEKQRRRAAEEKQRREAAEEKQRREAADEAEKQRRRAAEEKQRRRAAEEEQRRRAADEAEKQRRRSQKHEKRRRVAEMAGKQKGIGADNHEPVSRKGRRRRADPAREIHKTIENNGANKPSQTLEDSGAEGPGLPSRRGGGVIGSFLRTHLRSSRAAGPAATAPPKEQEAQSGRADGDRFNDTSFDKGDGDGEGLDSALEKYQEEFLKEQMEEFYAPSMPPSSSAPPQTLADPAPVPRRESATLISARRQKESEVQSPSVLDTTTSIPAAVYLDEDESASLLILPKNEYSDEGNIPDLQNLQVPPVYMVPNGDDLPETRRSSQGAVLRNKQEINSGDEEETLLSVVSSGGNTGNSRDSEIEMLKLKIHSLEESHTKTNHALKKNSTISRNDNDEETRYFITWVCLYLLLHITVTVLLIIIFSQVFPIRELFENSPWTIGLGIIFSLGAAVAVKMGFKYSKWLLIILIILGLSMLVTLLVVRYKIVLLVECLSIIAAFLVALIVYAKYITCCEFSCFIAGAVSLLSWTAYFFLAIGVPEVRSWVHSGNIWRNEEPELVHTLTLLVLSLIFNMYILWYLNMAMRKHNTLTILDASIEIYMKFMRTSIFFVLAYATICYHLGSMWDRAMNCCSRSSRASEVSAPVI